jgi:uncharacterized membrane protein YoaK (UPF0700 family)
MVHYDRRAIGLAICLSSLAGYVDALGFISLGGFFVSFMTGNSTRLGIELAGWQAGGIALAGGIVALFVCGVIAGSLIGHLGRSRRRAAVLAFVTLCLIMASALDTIGLGMAGVGVLAVAMGAENAVFQRDGEVTIGLTYMTGTLVKMGQRLAAAMLGGSRLAWIRPFLLWLSLVIGATLGAIAHTRLGLNAIWLAAAAAALLTLLAVRIGEAA